MDSAFVQRKMIMESEINFLLEHLEDWQIKPRISLGINVA